VVRTRNWPPVIAEYFEKLVFDSRSPAFLLSDWNGALLSQGGDLCRYGLDHLRKGDRVVEQAYFLEGLLPMDGERLSLCRVQTMAGVFADIHLWPSAQGDCILLLDASQDVSERTLIEQALRHTEERLRQAEKMEALGRLAGGVAHDFNNLLTIILGYSSILAEQASLGEFGEAARRIMEAAQQAAAMTQHLLSFSRRRVPQKEVLDFNKLIARLEKPLRRLIGEDITLTVVLKPAVSFVNADAAQMEQILMNLVANARDAMPSGGCLEICTDNVEVDKAFLETHRSLNLGYGPHVQIAVRDTGVGIDADTMTRVYEPFFTSKPPGRGTGLGLSIVYGIVTQAGGDIQLSSEVGKGTRVQILLPAAQEMPAEELTTQERRLPMGTGNILVVEDEDGVRSLVTAVLTRLGYTILECSDPLAAIAVCDQFPDRIDLLLTDLVMPKMDGSELASRISASRPETRVLYVSGYAKESFAQRGMELAGGRFLEKPFTPSRLAESVRDALAHPAPTIRAAQ
jgi:two-component system, cell cycle sensor histidine kinase and response regulator CckA